MVRVTNKVLSNTLIQDIRRNNAELLRLQRQVSTQKRVERPSDDPVNADRSVKLRHIIGKTQQFNKNVSDAKTFSSSVDVAINDMEALLLRARDLAVRGSNEAVWIQSNYDAIANEIDSILQEFINQSNQKFEGKYLFSGNRTSTKAFELSNSISFRHDAANGDVINVPNEALTDNNVTGGSLKGITVHHADGTQTVVNLAGGDAVIDAGANQIDLSGGALAGTLLDTDVVELTFDKIVGVKYMGDSGVRETEVSEGVRVGLNFTGAATDANRTTLFGAVSTDSRKTDTAQAFESLINFRDSIRKYYITNDISGANTAIQTIDDTRQRVTTVRAEVGGRVNRYQLAENRLANLEINTTEQLSDIEQVDLAEAISNFALQQQVLQAALGAGARIIQPTLLNFLQ